MAPQNLLITEHVDGSGSGLSNKWKYLILFGVPVVSAIALYYYARGKPSDKAKINGAKPKVDSEAKRRAEAHRLIEESLNAADPFTRSQGYKNKGNEHYKFAEFDKAVECYTEAIRYCPREKTEDLAIYYQNRAAAYLRYNKIDEAIEDCDKAIELNQTYVKALFRRAKAYEMKGDLKKCLEDITCVTVLEQFQNQTSLLLADKVIKAIGSEGAKQAIRNRTPVLPSKTFLRNYFISFVEDPVLLDLKDMESRIENNEQIDIAALSPYEHALYLVSQKDYENVSELCTKEIERNGQNLHKALLLRAAFSLLMGISDKAKQDVDRILSDPHADVKCKVNALIKSATAYVHEEKLQQALEEFQKAVDLDPNNADVYLHRSQAYFITNEIEESLKNLETSCKLNNNNPSAAAQKCYMKYRCGEKFSQATLCQEALKEFKEVQEKFPRCCEAFFLYAQILAEREQYQESYDFLEKASLVDPEDGNVIVHKGLLQLRWKQNIEEAKKLLKQAIDIDPKCQFAYETLASLQIQQGLTQEGMDTFDKAIEIAQTETELAQLIALRASAEAQITLSQRLGIPLPGNAQAA